MRRTLLAVGFAVIVSMLLAPHGEYFRGRQSHLEGVGPFFMDKIPYWRAEKTEPFSNPFDQFDYPPSQVKGYNTSKPELIIVLAGWDAYRIGPVMIDMLALEIVFLAVLFAVIVNIRWWPRKKNRKPTATANSSEAAAPSAYAPPLSASSVRPPNAAGKRRTTWSVILLLICFGAFVVLVIPASRDAPTRSTDNQPTQQQTATQQQKPWAKDPIAGERQPEWAKAPLVDSKQQPASKADYRVNVAGGVITVADANSGAVLGKTTLERWGVVAPNQDKLRHVALDVTAAVVAGNGGREHTVDPSAPVYTSADYENGKARDVTATLERGIAFAILSDAQANDRYEALIFRATFRPGP
jgi:hypothetical protein